MIDQVVETLVVLAKCVVMTLVASIKALLPMGVLPRKSVKGEAVLITGSGSGLGRGMAFAKLGSKVVLWDINEKGNMETKKMLDDLKAVVSSVQQQLSEN
ncbi:hypothetical protein ANCCAN_20040 [Ancylostoma caninum]|uniref:Uncharacterized protein n=1 Tax=Ancylostoma caninum TaxID=29170 RepID=A0A368FTK1_ANCCA|nr:hypothetical protein ANCCAN_20040 [Ancylostoma caninum]